MSATRKLLIGLSLFWCLTLSGIGMGQYRFDSWTTDNGLPQNGVREITQTPEGYLWFTTFDGLVRFDGLTFTTFNKGNTSGIINNRFTGIFADDDGTIYATTMEDGILTIYQHGKFTSYTSDQIPGHYINRVSKIDGEIRFLVEDDDRQTKSWYRLVNGVFEFIEKQKATNSGLVIRAANAFWTINPDGITETRDGRDTFFPIDLSRMVMDVNTFVDRSGALWFTQHKVHRIKDGVMRVFDEKDGLPEASVYHSLWDEADGSVWVSSGGVSSVSVGLLQIKDETVTFWGAEHGLLSSVISDVFVDREGTPWIATDKGLFRRKKQVIQSYGVKDGIDHNEVYPLLRARDNTIWIGSMRGLTTYKNGKFEAIELGQPSPGLPEKMTWKNGRAFVQSLWEDPRGRIWVGLSGGIFIIENGIATKVFSDSHVVAINSTSDGSVWAATNKGILKFEGDKVAVQYTKADGLPNDFITTIFEDSKGRIWFGGFGGLSQYVDGKFINYTTKEGLVGNYVRTIYEDNEGVLWVGTYDQGLSRFKDGKFTSYGVEDGLYNSGVFAIREDAAGYFWISSNRGIYRVSRAELNDFADGRISKINSVGYGREDGMLNNECNGGRQPSSLVDDQGRFWFPTQDGVSIVDPLQETRNPLAPTIVIESIIADREPIDMQTPATFAAGLKDLEIKYTGISLIKSEQVKFQYKLEGHDTEWVDAGTRRTAYYSYLPPGKYEFVVRAANSDGVWNEQGASKKLSLTPYFYQTEIFTLLAIAGAAVLLLLVWKISVHQLESRERKLTKLVTARTAELAEANKILQDLANSDGLTKIGNRRRFESFLTDEWHRAVRFRTPISLLLLDIDHFKLYNDTYGHQAGDDCLQVVARSLASVVKRPTDLVARFGGEEFAIVLGGTDAVGARQIADEVIATIKNLRIPHRSSRTRKILTISVGISTMEANLESSHIELVRDADRALYQAKANGRDQIYQTGQMMIDDIPVPMIIRDHMDAPPS